MYYCNKCGYGGEDGPGHKRRNGTECAYLACEAPGGEAASVKDVANTVAQFLPLGYTLSLRVERDEAWVEVTDPREVPVPLPDAADKSLYQQINDALCVACGWPSA